MIGRVWSDLRALADTWQAEGERRRQMTPADAAGDVLDYAAAELRERVRVLEGATLMLTSTEFGQVHGVCAQTVRGWCARGLLPGVLMAGGEWRIPRDTPAPATRILARAS